MGSWHLTAKPSRFSKLPASRSYSRATCRIWQGSFPGALWTVIGGGILFVAASNFTHADGARGLGFRADNLLESVFEVGTATVIVFIVLAGTGWLLGTLRPIEDWETRRFPWIFFWALVQQYALQDFVLQRMSQVFPQPAYRCTRIGWGLCLLALAESASGTPDRDHWVRLVPPLPAPS